MRRSSLPTLLLLPLTACLCLIPAAHLAGWRLSIYSLCLWAAERVAPPSPRPAPAPDLLREMQDILQQKDARIAELEQRLRHLSEAREFLPRLRFLSCAAIARPDGLQGDTLISGRGRADDLREGDAVLQGQALVGTVAQVGPRASTVRLLSSPACFVVARTSVSLPGGSASRDDCSVQGLGNGRARVVFYSTSVAAPAEAVVLTSGLLERLPPDVLIGVLAEAPREGVEPNTLEADIRLRADFTSLDDLLVVQRTEGGRPPAP